MNDAARLPQHLEVLRVEWATLIAWLERDIRAPLPIVTRVLHANDVNRCSALLQAENAALAAWVERLTAWMNGPLRQGLENPDIPDADMRRIAGRLAHFASELVERRQQLAQGAGQPAMHAAAPRMDALYFSLLIQLREFTTRVVAALDSVPDPARGAPGDSIELSFTFSPDITEPAAALSAWIRQQQARLTAVATTAPAEGGANAAGKKRVIRAIEVGLGVFLAAAILAAILAAPALAALIAVLVAVVVFVLRHPFIVLIAFILGWGGG